MAAYILAKASVNTLKFNNLMRILEGILFVVTDWICVAPLLLFLCLLGVLLMCANVLSIVHMTLIVRR